MSYFQPHHVTHVHRTMNYPSIYFLLSCLLQLIAARPTVLHEQNLGYYNAFCQGAYVGFQDLLALMGYYESDEATEGMESGEIVIDEENRTQM